MTATRTIAAAVMLLLLAGCSYRPLYGSSEDNAGVAATLASVSIPEAKTRTGQIIRNDLISAMQSGRSGEERYSLNLAPDVKTTGVIEKILPATTRRAVHISVDYELIDRRSGQAVHKGRTFSQASYDVVREPFADMQAETDATARAAHEVSADIRTRLAAFFATQQ